MSGNRIIDINVTDYILGAIDFFPEDIKWRASLCATMHIFNIMADQEILNKEQKGIFHTIVANLLWIL